jgi:hypothetical protein
VQNGIFGRQEMLALVKTEEIGSKKSSRMWKRVAERKKK